MLDMEVALRQSVLSCAAGVSLMSVALQVLHHIVHVCIANYVDSILWRMADAGTAL